MTARAETYAHLRKLAEEATPGPWANTDNVKEMFDYEPMDWWYVYAKRPDDDEFAPVPELVCKMAGHRATKQEMEKARFEQFNEHKPCCDPGQAGKDARYIAAASPATMLDLLHDIEESDMALGDADRECERLWQFVMEVGRALHLHEDQLERGAWPTLATIRNELESTLRDNEYLGQTAYMMGYQDGKKHMEAMNNKPKEFMFRHFLLQFAELLDLPQPFLEGDMLALVLAIKEAIHDLKHDAAQREYEANWLADALRLKGFVHPNGFKGPYTAEGIREGWRNEARKAFEMGITQ